MLPKAGNWMTLVKRLFGFVLLWAAVYFLKPFVPASAYRIVSAVILVFAVVFMRCLDALGADSGFAPRLGRAVGILALILALLLAVQGLAPVLGLSLGQTAPAPDAFEPASAEDVQSAVEAGQPVVLKFWADYCTICKALEARLNADPRVHEALQGVRALKVDVQEYPDVAGKYGVVGVPALRFIDAQGDVREDLNSGDQTVPELLDRIETLKEGS
jgi:thiol:disulfide interchange protein DsbD